VKCGARVALGVIGGYFLGRTKKMKLAMMLGGMAAGRKAGGPGELLRTGSKLLNSSPELARLTEEVRGRLLEAGKGAALAVAARQVESLTDRVGKRVESLGDVGVPRRKKSEEPEDDYEDEPVDEAAQIWRHMRKNSKKARRPLNASNESLEFMQSADERLVELRKRAIRNKRSIGADTLRSLSLALTIPTSAESGDGTAPWL